MIGVGGALLVVEDLLVVVGASVVVVVVVVVVVLVVVEEGENILPDVVLLNEAVLTTFSSSRDSDSIDSSDSSNFGLGVEEVAGNGGSLVDVI